MNKEKFINFFTKEEQSSAIKVYNSLQMSMDYNTLILVDEFLTPNIWYKTSLFLKNYNIKIITDGFFDNAERRMVAFYPNEWVSPIEFPYVVIKITNKSKFKKLEHRHYLGTILSLGLRREKIGDVLLNNDTCYFAIVDDIAEYIINSLEKINGCAVSIEKIAKEDYLSIQSSIELKEKIILSSSMRIDCIVSAVTNLSRSKGEAIISSGKVMVDYSIVNKKNFEIKEGSRLTIRGFGKFIVSEIVGTTKKDRFRVKLLQYK
ncbi:YlmH family RNA-binding protein [Oceanirhabdus sp. W0125-5]|uniref:YlmH family RNA-binding protein n=1 Tax=Oceanirhabdus sp. W0125-5 TaxID=2999116 RepID=UPI0022F2DA87|nr:YlmH/Sll1252 family protein [Oceanirhabdus sp. W0125-5]WBW95348.1 YlmH/Sll1252 family protein [Oceanirhabdus sp. W0125-5]